MRPHDSVWKRFGAGWSAWSANHTFARAYAPITLKEIAMLEIILAFARGWFLGCVGGVLLFLLLVLYMGCAFVHDLIFPEYHGDNEETLDEFFERWNPRQR
jgi:hypothetical protein